MPPRRKPDPPSRRIWGQGSVSFDQRRQRWRARAPRDAAGKRAATYHATREGAEAWLADEIVRVARSNAPFDSSRPFGALLNYWYSLHAGRWTPNQKRKIRSQINVCRPIAHHPASGLTALHIDAFLAGKHERTPGYVRHLGRLIYRVLAWAERRKILDENVAADVELPASRRKPPKAYTPVEVRQITTAARGERFEAAFLLFVHAGCRMGEVLSMPWTAIDADTNTVRVENAEQTAAGRIITGPKYESTGTVDVAPPIMRRLMELHDRATSLWILGKPDTMIRPHDRKRTGHERWCDSTVRRDWYALLKRIRVRRLTPHGGRHSFATGHMMTGTDLADIADLMRHKSPAVTAAIYLSGNAKRRKAAAERLGALFAVTGSEAEDAEAGAPK